MKRFNGGRGEIKQKYKSSRESFYAHHNFQSQNIIRLRQVKASTSFMSGIQSICPTSITQLFSLELGSRISLLPTLSEDQKIMLFYCI